MSEEKSIQFITVLPKVPFKCHYILNDGEEHWMNYEDMLKFCQDNCPEKSAELMELFITHESFIIDVYQKKIEILVPDSNVYEANMKKILINSRNPASAFQDHMKQQNEKITFEQRIINSNQGILDNMYKSERDRK